MTSVISRIYQFDSNTIFTGFEVWLVQDFDKGPGESLWFQGKSHRYLDAYHFAVLNFINLKIPEIDLSKNKLLNEFDLYFLRKKIMLEMGIRLNFEKIPIGNRVDVVCTLTSLYREDISITVTYSTVSMRKNAGKVSRQNAINATKKEAEKRPKKRYSKKFSELTDQQHSWLISLDVLLKKTDLTVTIELLVEGIKNAMNFSLLSFLRFDRRYQRMVQCYLSLITIQHDVKVYLKNFIMNLSSKIALWSTVKMNKLPKNKSKHANEK